MGSRFVHGGLIALLVTGAACGGGDSDAGSDVAEDPAASVETTGDAGVRLVSAGDAAATIDSPPDGLVILDVRTPDEFDDGHIDGAQLIDFYDAEFADQIADLDRDIPYVLYCRSGNRSAQTSVLMEELGFTSVAEVDGGVLAWESDDLPLVDR